ncbi:MAG: class I SAM-dependent methyltransferase [Bacillota bacterium]|nr:class I SAM-dependent methyltransferase [Bacillota bacterium]
MQNIKYYNDNSIKYVNSTFNTNMSLLYDKFETYLKPKCHILDLGCGSGRDSLYFHNKNYKVTSVDGSNEMIKYCETILKNKIIHSTFKDFNASYKFDGIWACASLLHVKKENIKNIIFKYISFLNIEGIFFISFKDRDTDFSKDGRDFTCFSKYSLENLLKQFDNIKILEFVETTDVRDNREDEKWISVIFKKIL